MAKSGFLGQSISATAEAVGSLRVKFGGSNWSTTGYARCEWPLNSRFVSEDRSISADDSDSFSRPTTARLIARRDHCALAPELLSGSRQPDSLSNAFSLAVAVYALLRTAHPFDNSGCQSDPAREFVEPASEDP